MKNKYTKYLLLSLALLAIIFSTANFQKKNYVSCAATAITGDGSLEAPYEIPDAETLNSTEMRAKLSANYTVPTYFVLSSDINLSGENWGPLTAGNFVFFNGGGFKISGLTITKTDETSLAAAGSSWGLFGSVGTDAKISNLTLSGANITIKNSASGTKLSIGALTGKVGNNAVFENITLTDINITITECTAPLDLGGIAGTVSSGTIILNNALSSGTSEIKVNAKANCYTGGLVGYGSTKISKGHNYANISASIESDSFTLAVGGLTGYSSSLTVTDGYNGGDINAHGKVNASGSTSTVVGGISAYTSTSSFSKCTNVGDISCESAGYAYAAGIVGYGTTITIKDSGNKGSVNIITHSKTAAAICSAGGLLGLKSYGAGNVEISDCYNSGDVTGESLAESGTPSVLRLGGLVGVAQQNIEISYCNNEGNINGTSQSSAVYLGGIIGSVELNNANTVNVEISSSFSTAEINGVSSYNDQDVYVGGLVGNVVQAQPTGTTANLVIDNSYFDSDAINTEPVVSDALLSLVTIVYQNITGIGEGTSDSSNGTKYTTEAMQSLDFIDVLNSNESENDIIHWVYNNGSVTSGQFCVITFMLGNDVYEKTLFELDSTIPTPDAPQALSSDSNYTYHFKGWSNLPGVSFNGDVLTSLPDASASHTFYAVFSRIGIVKINEVSLATQKRGTAFNADFTASCADSGNIAFEVVNGNLPNGLTLDKETGKISGTLSAVGTFTFTIRATNKDTQASSLKEFTITVDQAENLNLGLYFIFGALLLAVLIMSIIDSKIKAKK